MTGFLGKYKNREMRFYRGWFTQILVCFIVKDSSKTLEVLRLFSLLLCSFSSSFPFLYSSCYFAFKGLRPSTQLVMYFLKSSDIAWSSNPPKNYNYSN